MVRTLSWADKAFHLAGGGPTGQIEYEKVLSLPANLRQGAYETLMNQKSWSPGAHMGPTWRTWPHQGLTEPKCWRYVEEQLAVKLLVASRPDLACDQEHKTHPQTWAAGMVAALRSSSAAHRTCPEKPLWVEVEMPVLRDPQCQRRMGVTRRTRLLPETLRPVRLRWLHCTRRRCHPLRDLFAARPGRLLLIGDSTMEQLVDALECDLVESGCSLATKQRHATSGTGMYITRNVSCPGVTTSSIAFFALGHWDMLAYKGMTGADVSAMLGDADMALLGFGHHGIDGHQRLLDVTLERSRSSHRGKFHAAWVEMTETHWPTVRSEFSKQMVDPSTPPIGFLCRPQLSNESYASPRATPQWAFAGAGFGIIRTSHISASRWDLHGDHITVDGADAYTPLNTSKCGAGRDCLHLAYSPLFYEPIIDNIVSALS